MAHTRAIRAEAQRLLKAGLTYTEIHSKIGISKSTLSTWFGVSAKNKKPRDRARQLRHLAKARVRATEVIRAKRLAWMRTAHEKGRMEACALDLDDAHLSKALLAMLYWAEGTKSVYAPGLIFTNTDPALMGLYIALLRRSYPLVESRLRVRLHLHHYHQHGAAVHFWSQLLQIADSQFGKIYVKKRNRHKHFRKNFQGICFVRYFDSKIREELLALGRALAEKI